MAGPGDLEALAEAVLAAAAGALDTIPVFEPTLLGSPERQFSSPGLPAYDCCDQLAVVATLGADAPTTPTGLAAGKRHLTGKVNHVTLAIHATRCVPILDESGNPPSAAELQASAAQVNADGWALWNHLYNLKRAGQISDLCDELFFEGIRSINPSGGCGGWVLTLRAQLAGYQETIGT